MNAQEQAARELQDRLGLLARTAAEHNRAKRKRQLFALVGGVVAVVLCFVTFGRLHEQGRLLNAEAVSQLGRSEVEKRLPDAASALADHLKTEAPGLVHGGINEVIAVLPNARDWAFRGATTKFADYNTKFERQIQTEMHRVIIETHRSVDRLNPTKSDEEKLQLLMRSVTSKFEQNFAAALTDLYPHYSREINNLHTTIHGLQRQDPKTLPPRDRIVREILETMAQLAELEKKKRGSVN